METLPVETDPLKSAKPKGFLTKPFLFSDKPIRHPNPKPSLSSLIPTHNDTICALPLGMHKNNLHCPTPHCPAQPKYSKRGHFYVKRLNRYYQKFQCPLCKKIFSHRTFQLDRYHKKRDLNFPLAQLLVEGVSLRGASRLLNLSYSNTYKKFIWFNKWLRPKIDQLQIPSDKLQIDELETIHHTKCKPLSICLIVNDQHQLVSANVAQIPAKGLLATISRAKYGLRPSNRPDIIELSLSQAVNRVKNQIQLIESDASSSYRGLIRKIFGNILYQYHQRSKKPKTRELLFTSTEKRQFDPLFAVNHQCARLRSQIKRLTRRSWCTTKKIENLQLHLDLFLVMQFERG